MADQPAPDSDNENNRPIERLNHFKAGWDEAERTRQVLGDTSRLAKKRYEDLLAELEPERASIARFDKAGYDALRDYLSQLQITVEARLAEMEIASSSSSQQTAAPPSQTVTHHHYAANPPAGNTSSASNSPGSGNSSTNGKQPGLLTRFWHHTNTGAENDGLYKILFFLTLAFHLWVVLQDIPPVIGPFIWFYALFVVLIALVFFFNSRREELGPVMMVSLAAILAYASPGLISKFFGMSQETMTLLTRAAIIAPVWPLYALSRAGGRFHWWFSLYRWILLILIVIFVVIPAFALMPNVNQEVGNRLDAMSSLSTLPGEAKEYVIDFFKKGQHMMNQTMNPSTYYSGQVESNKDKPLGVTITDLRTQDRIVSNESEIVVFGTVSAKSFIGESIRVEPDCRLENSKEFPQRSMSEPSLDIIFGSSKSFECTLSPQPEWRRGSKTVLTTVTFPFQTWSYITYTFVDEERARNIARQGQDMREVFKIEERPTATYTSGPISVGMGGTLQPILVRPDKTPIIPAGTRVGVTVDSGWQKGRIQKVERFELKVPQPFSLIKCDRDWVDDGQEDVNDAQYTNYIFPNPELDSTTTFSSVTCQLMIDPAKQDEARSLISGGDKAQRSFIAVVNYRYSVEERTTVQVT